MEPQRLGDDRVCHLSSIRFDPAQPPRVVRELEDEPVERARDVVRGQADHVDEIASDGVVEAGSPCEDLAGERRVAAAAARAEQRRSFGQVPPGPAARQDRSVTDWKREGALAQAPGVRIAGRQAGCEQHELVEGQVPQRDSEVSILLEV